MADRLILLAKDPQRAQTITQQFAERTGLQPTPIDGGTRFELGPDDHEVKVTQTLTDIDPGWTDAIELGDPAETDRPGDPDA